MDKFNTVNRDLSEVTLKLIRHCIFDDRLHIWKTICPEQLCQQAETEQQGAAFLEKYLWFILLGESPLLTVKASVWNNNAFQSSCPGKYCSRLSSGTDTGRPARKEAQVRAKWSWKDMKRCWRSPKQYRFPKASQTVPLAGEHKVSLCWEHFQCAGFKFWNLYLQLNQAGFAALS